MRKVISLIIVVVLSIGVAAGCGSKKVSTDGGENTSKPTTGQNETSKEPTKDKPNVDVTVPGTELSTFMNDYLEAKTKTWDAMTKQLETEQNLEFTMGILPYSFADLAIVEIAFFDALTVKDGDSFKGKLFLTDIDAWKKVQGDIIEFGYDYTYTDDKNQYKKGDHEISKGKYDKLKKSLVYEHYSENDGTNKLRTVVEITRNSDKSYSCQIFTIGDSQNDAKGKTLTGYFTWFEGENMLSVMAEKENVDFQFTYNSIFGKQNVKPENMADGMNIVSKVSMIDGKAVYESNQK